MGRCYTLPDIEQVARHTQNTRVSRGLHQNVQCNVSEPRVRCDHLNNLGLNPTRNPLARHECQHLQTVVRKERFNLSGLCPIAVGKPPRNIVLEDAMLEQALPPIRVAQVLALIRQA